MENKKSDLPCLVETENDAIPFVSLWTGKISEMALATRAGEWITCGRGKLFSTPILQVLKTRKVHKPNGGHLWRLILSDGEFYMQGILDTTNNCNVMDQYTVVRLDHFTLTALVRNPVPVLKVHSYTVWNSLVRSKIGVPLGIDLETLKILDKS